jgi:poly(A) RNA polymerase
MSLLYEKQCLSELDIRLRYFLCSEIEAVVRKLYPYAVAQPFGSSVNGFGRFNCDLDIVLDLWGAKQNLVT